MEFSLQKTQALERTDKSKKGNIDVLVEPHITLINAVPGFYTTSSCSGRIILIEKDNTAQKKDSNFILTSHRSVEKEKIDAALESKTKGYVWLLQQYAIFHIACESMPGAIKLLDLARTAGFRSSGIIAVKDKTMVDIKTVNGVSVIVKRDDNILVGDDHLHEICHDMKHKMEENRNKLQSLYEKLTTLPR